MARTDRLPAHLDAVSLAPGQPTCPGHPFPDAAIAKNTPGASPQETGTKPPAYRLTRQHGTVPPRAPI
ncbi:hypothetical protein GCM10011415_22960 [Salipiger pallidus]|uniref:Uncharacterized protein n=1 Tax=Salipiger pallidus TaxID=1775170 RepID=A0A8J3EGV4_9RHOB|nr:hypothetical protein GCM10011415_22960 [Salipiger pallidus]